MHKIFLIAALALPLSAAPPKPIPALTQQRWTGTTNGWYPWSASDKLGHFETGAGIGFVSYAIYRDGLKLDHPWLWAWVTTTILGLGKEIYDRHHNGSPEWADALNTSAGEAIGGLGMKIIFGLDKGHHYVRIQPAVKP